MLLRNAMRRPRAVEYGSLSWEDLNRQFRKFFFDPLNPFGRDNQRGQIGVREITVIVGIFLGTHFAGFPFVRIVKARCLNDFSAAFDQFDLAFDFIIDCIFQIAEGVQVLDFATGSECSRAGGTNRHVGVATERTFLHVTIRNTEPGYE